MTELVTSLSGDRDPVRVTYGHNYLFEERVSESRQAGYEGALELPGTTLAAWKERHRDYLYRRVYANSGQQPETFGAVNSDAQLTGLAETQWVVRVENLDRALFHQGDRIDLALVDEQLAVWRRRTDRQAATRARRFLEQFCEHWNLAVRRDDRPSFAAFFDEVEDEITADDWANRLRDRLGLSHYHAPDAARPIPVALVRYRVAEVLAGSREPAFAVPTVLDGELNSHFFPAPREIGYGRSLDLEPDVDCERLVAEVLHRRLDYAPKHLYKVGWITTPIPPYSRGAAFARLRNGHRFCLLYESDRESFGEDIPEGGDG